MNADQQETANRSGISRRGFLQDAAAAAGGLVASPCARGAAQAGWINSFRHVTIDGDRRTWCGHLRQCGIKSFGGGELAVLYRRAPLASDASRADVVLRRSGDGGRTWPVEQETIVWSEALPLDKRAGFLCQDPAQRQVLDMSRPEALFFFGRTPIRLARTVRNTKLGWTCALSLSGAGTEPCTAFQIRSIDKGRTWERAALVLDPPPGVKSCWRDNHPLVTMPDGALVGAVESEGAIWLYGSENHGMTWQYLSLIAMGKAGAGKPCCAGLVVLPSGRLQCYLLMLGGQSGALCLSQSEDCFRWSEPRRIAGDVHSPWPVRLGDGRIVVVFARRQPPAGIAAVVSTDDGNTWSDAAMIRDAARGTGSGSPVATELADGRMFAAYQYQPPEGDRFDAAQSIVGSFFELS